MDTGGGVKDTVSSLLPWEKGLVLQVITEKSAWLTGKRVAWSLRCPRFSLQAGVGGAGEAAKAGLSFPQEGRPPPEGLLPGRLKTPTGRRRREISDRFGGKKMEKKAAFEGRKDAKYGGRKGEE